MTAHETSIQKTKDMATKKENMFEKKIYKF